MPQSLRDEAHALNVTAPQGPRSEVDKLAAILPDDLRAEFVEAVNDHSVPHQGLRAAMARRGYDIPLTSIQHFRKSGKRL